MRQWNVWSTYVRKVALVLGHMTWSPQRRRSPVASSPRVKVSSSWLNTLPRVRKGWMEGAQGVRGCGSFLDCTPQSVSTMIVAEFLFAGNFIRFLIDLTYIKCSNVLEPTRYKYMFDFCHEFELCWLQHNGALELSLTLP